MRTTVLSRPLVCLAKHELAFARTASRSSAKTQRHLSTVQHSRTFVPDYLLPLLFTKKHPPSTVSHPYRRLPQSALANPGHPLQWRLFSASPSAKIAVVSANPRKDEDGNEMLIDITARAANVCSFCCLRPHFITTANNHSSVLKKS